MNAPKRYRKRPMVIEAMQWTGDNIHQIWDWAGAQDVYGPTEKNLNSLIISTLEGKMRCNLGDFVLKGIRGELYPCEKSIFIESYEEVEDTSTERKSDG